MISNSVWSNDNKPCFKPDANAAHIIHTNTKPSNNNNDSNNHNNKITIVTIITIVVINLNLNQSHHPRKFSWKTKDQVVSYILVYILLLSIIELTIF